MTVMNRRWIAAVAIALAPCAWSMRSFAQEDPQDAPPPHPEPRVIVSVTRVRGPHDPKAVETAARTAWGRIVRCYKRTKHGRKLPRGTVVARVEIRANGDVIGARRRGGTL